MYFPLKSFLKTLYSCCYLHPIFIIAVAVLTLVPTPRAGASTGRASKLLELARQEFGTLTKAEEKLFRAVAEGKPADYRAKEEKDNDPAFAEKWGNDRAINSSRIAWLCTDLKAIKLVDHKGILVKGARFEGNLLLPRAKIPFPLIFRKCAFLGSVDLRNAVIRSLILTGTHTKLILASLMEVKEHVILARGFKAVGGVNLVGSKIDGFLDCSNGQFINKGKIALNAEQIDVKGHVNLSNGFKANGQVRFATAKIGGQLTCKGGIFENKGLEAFSGHQMSVVEDVFLNEGFSVRGELLLVGSTIGGNLVCSGGHFINDGSNAISAGGLKVDGSVFMRKSFLAHGEVNFNEAMIGGSFKCENSSFMNEGGTALSLGGSDIERGLFMRNGFQATGGINLVGTKIGGQFSCSGGQFINKGKLTIAADQARVGECVFLGNGFSSEGIVRITDSEIGGQLYCNGGHFINDEGICLLVQSTKIGKSVYMGKDFQSQGEVRLIGSNIEGFLECSSGQFINKGKIALNAEQLKVEKSDVFTDGLLAQWEVSYVGAEVRGRFMWIKISSPADLILDLQYAKIHALEDDYTSWPLEGKLFLFGLVYNILEPKELFEPQTRLEWLRRQPASYFRNQPYQQLAKVFRNNGRDDYAQQILIAKNQDRGRFTQLTFFEWLWYRVFGPVIGYGYSPFRVVWIGLIFVVIGYLFFKLGYRKGLITPIPDDPYLSRANGRLQRLSSDYPTFNSLIYSLDMFIPLINLHQGNYWLPNTNKRAKLNIYENFKPSISGHFLRIYLWIHIFAGWLLTLIRPPLVKG